MPRKIKKLDKKDKDLLKILNQNARISQTRLSKLAHISRELAAYRIKKLEKEKFISGYNLIISNTKLNFKTYTILIKIQNVTNEALERICSFIKKNRNIKYFDRCSGDWDLILTIAVKNKFGLSDFIEEINEEFGENIAENHVLINIVPLKHGNLEIISKMNYKIKKPEKYYGKIRIDNKDRRILNTLSKSPKLPISELARRTNLNPETCSNRFNRLIKIGIISGAKAIINHTKLGYTRYVIFLRINKFSNEKRRKIAKFLKTQDKVIFAERVIGNYDLKINILAENPKQFDEQFNILRSYFKDNLKNYSLSLVLENLKIVSFPKVMW